MLHFYIFGEDCDFIGYDAYGRNESPSSCVWMVPGTWDEPEIIHEWICGNTTTIQV